MLPLVINADDAASQDYANGVGERVVGTEPSQGPLSHDGNSRLLAGTYHEGLSGADLDSWLDRRDSRLQNPFPLYLITVREARSTIGFAVELGVYLASFLCLVFVDVLIHFVLDKKDVCLRAVVPSTYCCTATAHWRPYEIHFIRAAIASLLVCPPSGCCSKYGGVFPEGVHGYVAI